jgi:hypothetical protein
MRWLLTLPVWLIAGRCRVRRCTDNTTLVLIETGVLKPQLLLVLPLLFPTRRRRGSPSARMSARARQTTTAFLACHLPMDAAERPPS